VFAQRFMRSIYLDYNATTPLDPAVREAMLPFLDSLWGNPSSVHRVGRQVRARLDEFRERTASVLHCKPSEVVFGSGGTESNNLAILGSARRQRAKGRHLVTSSIEHPAVLSCFEYLERHEGFAVTYLNVQHHGHVEVEDVRHALRPDTVLVSLMAANNEIGSVQPVAEVGALCRERGVLFHTDAVQWFGKEAFGSVDQFNADLVSICAHKFHGPKGAGVLYVRSPFQPESTALGGAHENERRAGTENMAGIAGLVSAIERFVKSPVFEPDQMKNLSSVLREALEAIPAVHVVSPRSGCLLNTVSAVVENTDSITLLANLDLEGICASSGSACAAGSLEPSHVVTALGHPQHLAQSLVRFSVGRETTPHDIHEVSALLPELVYRSRSGR
jgi:cysteine desulfurase